MKPKSNFDFRTEVDHYLSKWKMFALCILVALGIAYTYLRYVSYEYEATAIIKINNEKQNNKLPELSALQDYGMFSSDFNNIIDEIEVIKSRALIKSVVEDLKLNIKYFVRGRIAEQEIYKNPPIHLSFFESDSLINTIDTTLYVKIISNEKFKLSNEQHNDLLNIDNEDATTHAFGDRIKTGFGDFIIIPNSGEYNPKIGASIKLDMSPISQTVESYQSKINVGTEKGSSILKLSVNENIREKAKLILDKLIEKYNDDVVNDKQLIVKATSDFINSRLEIVASELELVDFTAETMQKNNRLTALASQSSIFLQSEKENEARLIQTSNQIQLIDYMQQHLTDNNKTSDLLPADIGIADNGVAQLTKSHNDLVLQRNRILKSSTEKNPTVINLDNQIRALKDNLDQSLKNIQSGNQITLNSLNQEDARINAQIYSAPTKARQFRDVKRQQDIKESLYLYLLQKREETAISLGLSSPNAKIVDEAYATIMPVNPKKSVVYLASLILGIMVPFGFIYTKNLMNTKVGSKAELEKVLSVPYLGDIPKQGNKKRPVISKVDYSPKAEAFRIIRSNIDFILKEINTDCKTIFVTSTTSQEGKSHTSVNLASSISFSEKRTLLIETDIRVPKVKEYFKLKYENGLTDYLVDKSLTIKDITITKEDNPFLSVIPAGTIPPNPAELLMTDRMKNLFEEVKNDYDFIIVDTAAVGLVTDTFLISDHADMFVYVVSANNIDKRELHKAQTIYDEKRLPKMTLLLNGTIGRKGYGYGYGAAPKKAKKWYKF
ncbi:MAG: tyrosine protein kinase [Bacteroidetes bacterium MedPE-SWsnd-G2]|nr:MAG: tyrosine protein kinase [Bacteroidetes bacterium MedPE-SWsnd-G2]